MNKRDFSESTVLVTGGAGFIGSNFIHYWLDKYDDARVINLDALTYAGNLESLRAVSDDPRYRFIEGSITDRELLNDLMPEVDVVAHFAAESHVDRSIHNPAIFIETNVNGTFELLEAALRHDVEHFHHVSTDEVFGSLKLDSDEEFTEDTHYDPRSPYSASKASSDHLVRAYGETYDLPFTITNCSNNYGPFHHPEKLFPLFITNIIDGKKLPIYGDGKNVRDWLYVTDHCRAIDMIMHGGQPQDTYLVGGMYKDVSNLEAIHMIIDIMDADESLIEYVEDRAGHDRRYAVDFSKLHDELGWEPSVDLREGLEKTIDWYQTNEDWWRQLKEASKDFFEKNYGAHKE